MTLSIAIGQIAVVALAALYVRKQSLRRLDGSPQGFDRATQAFSTGQFVLLVLIAALLTGTMTLTPWASLVRREWGLDRLPLVGDLTLLVPFFASLAVIWAIQFPVEARLRGVFFPSEREPAPPIDEARKTDAATALSAASNGRPPPDASVFTFLWDKFRHQVLIVAAPMALIVAAKHFTDLWRRDLMNATTLPWAADAVLGIISFLVLLISPVILCYIWATEPLPPGPLRERFERICKRIGLRYRDVLLWHTHGMTVNAAVMGFIPPLRYILVSDALLETMDDEEIEAVFGHEAGHVHHWHLPFFGLFALASMYVTGGVLELLVRGRVITDSGLLQLIGLVVLLGLWLFGFGWLSRRFERQADLFGVRSVTPDIQNCLSWCPIHGERQASGVCVSAANLFGRTLSKIAGLNGIPKAAPSWRHGSIESRCRLIERFAQDAAAVNRFDRQLWLLKMGLLGAGIVGTIAAGMVYYGEIARAWRRVFLMG
ncbi:MAG TPA: M48 family metallopeptidase [Phycisphaerae bacterium]|nr:M48 family metallopeptidase [Phycisphaerae bacterium]